MVLLEKIFNYRIVYIKVLAAGFSLAKQTEIYNSDKSTAPARVPTRPEWIIHLANDWKFIVRIF